MMRGFLLVVAGIAPARSCALAPALRLDSEAISALFNKFRRFIVQHNPATRALCYFCCMLRFGSALFLAAGFAAAQHATLHWMPVASPKIHVAGLPWFQENHGEFWRLSARSQDAFPKEVWRLSLDPTGGRIRFRTDSSAVALRLEWPHPPGMSNMQFFGQSGVDLYVRNTYWGTAVPDKDAAPGKVYEHVYFRGRPQVMRDITIYLSLYSPVKVLEIGLDKDAALEFAAPFAGAKPVVFYGTSITQGGCASRPGMSYQAILGRQLNLDHVNLGFSGNGKGEAAVARAVGEIDAAAFVLDFAQNNKDVDSLAQVYDPFIGILRERHPDTPIMAITPIYAASEAAGSQRNEQMRALIRRVVSRRIAAGDTHLQLVEGTDLLGPARVDGLVDGTHPNDLGFQWMAEGLAERLRKVLGL
jgi:lysophospholipase L1-like esterase